MLDCIDSRYLPLFLLIVHSDFFTQLKFTLLTSHCPNFHICRNFFQSFFVNSNNIFYSTYEVLCSYFVLSQIKNHRKTLISQKYQHIFQNLYDYNKKKIYNAIKLHTSFILLTSSPTTRNLKTPLCTSILILRAINYLCTQLIKTFLVQLTKFKETEIYDKRPSSLTTKRTVPSINLRWAGPQ